MVADVTFAYTNLAIGGGIFTAENMKQVKEAGITHIIDCQAEFDDTPLAKPLGIEVLWCPVWDDFGEPDVRQFRRAAKFTEDVLLKGDTNNKLLVHCAGGVHRGPMFAYLACLVCGIKSSEAIRQIEGTRLIARFPQTYRKAVERFIEKEHRTRR